MDDQSTRNRAFAMRNLSIWDRNTAISTADNVTDSRQRFEQRRAKVDLARVYRKPAKPEN